MAPLFDEMAPADRKGATIPRFMFQKPAIGDVSAVNLDTPGVSTHSERPADYGLDEELYRNRVLRSRSGLLSQWYVRPPKIAPSIRIADQAGKAKDVFLSLERIAGAW